MALGETSVRDAPVAAAWLPSVTACLEILRAERSARLDAQGEPP
jgi:hypothetical protein